VELLFKIIHWENEVYKNYSRENDFLMKIVSEYLKVILPKKTFKAFTLLFNKFVDLK